MFKLSKFHRYGIALLALIVVVAFLACKRKIPQRYCSKPAYRYPTTYYP